MLGGAEVFCIYVVAEHDRHVKVDAVGFRNALMLEARHRN